MSLIKISLMPPAGSVVSGDLFEIDRSGNTYSVTSDEIVADVVAQETSDVATLTGLIGTESTNRTSADGTLTTNLAAEIVRAEAAEALKAPLASPTFTTSAAAPTPTVNDSSTKIATTAFVQNALFNTSAPSTYKPWIGMNEALDCSGSPNYPAALKPVDTYTVSVKGLIGGASGKYVSVGDTIVSIVANAGGNEAVVGTNWYILQGKQIWKGTGTDSIIAGDYINNTASGTNSITGGTTNTNSGVHALCIGSANTNSGTSSFVNGNGNTNSVVSSLVSGSLNNNSGTYSLITGTTNTNTSSDSVISGESNTNHGVDSIISGNININTAINGIVTGENNTNGCRSSAILGGNGNIITGSNNYDGILGGFGNTLNSGGGAIIAGNSNSGTGAGIIMLGCQTRTVTQTYTTYVENLTSFGGRQKNVNTYSSAQTLTNTNHIVFVDCSGGTVLIKLPTVPILGQEYEIVDSIGSAASHTITVSSNSGPNINGASTTTITVAYGSVRVIFNGTIWNIMSKIIL